MHCRGHIYVLLRLTYGGLHCVCCLLEGCCQAERWVGARPLLLPCRLPICRLLVARARGAPPAASPRGAGRSGVRRGMVNLVFSLCILS